jgi:hypothetical protein
MSENGVQRCTGLAGTGYFVCSRRVGPPSALAGVVTEQVPTALVYATSDDWWSTTDADRPVITAKSTPGPSVSTRPLAIATGAELEMVWDLEVSPGAAEPRDETSVATVDVIVDGSLVAKASTTKDGEREHLVLPFAVRPNQLFATRLWYGGRGRVVIDTAVLQAAHAPDGPPPP